MIQFNQEVNRIENLLILEDYDVIEILGITDKNLANFNNKIKLAKDAKGSNLTKVEIIELVQELINKLNESEETVNLTEPIEEKVKVDENNNNKQDESLDESKTEIEISHEQKSNKEESVNQTKSSEITNQIKEI